MDELPGRELHQVRHLFDAEHLALVIDAMVAGNSPATAWVDDGARPRAVAIWDGAHSLHIAGAPDRAGVFSAPVARHVASARPGCGIGIETMPTYRGRGVATLTASAFVEYCAARGITPHWDSWPGNAPSVAVAEKVGFRKVETYRVFVTNLA